MKDIQIIEDCDYNVKLEIEQVEGGVEILATPNEPLNLNFDVYRGYKRFTADLRCEFCFNIDKVNKSEKDADFEVLKDCYFINEEIDDNPISEALGILDMYRVDAGGVIFVDHDNPDREQVELWQDVHDAAYGQEINAIEAIFANYRDLLPEKNDDELYRVTLMDVVINGVNRYDVEE